MSYRNLKSESVTLNYFEDEIARERIQSHEIVCERRYEEIKESLGDLYFLLKGVENKFGMALVGIIGLLLSLCTFLLFVVFKDHLV